MGIYQHGARRRRIVVVGPPTPAGTPPPVPPVDLPAILIVPRFPSPRRPSRIGLAIHRTITPFDYVSIPRPRPTFPVAVVARGRKPQSPILVRPQQLDAPPPPPVTQYPPKVVVVQTMGIRYQLGRRRRRVQVYSTNVTTSSGVISGAARSRVTVVQRYPARKPSWESLGVFTRTVRPTGVDTPPPPIGGGGSAKPLQPTWLGINRAYSPKPRVRPIIVHTRFIPPTKDGLPNQVVIVPPQRRRRPVPAVVIHPTFKWGLNAGKTPNPPVIASRPPRGRRLKGIVTVLPVPAISIEPPTANPVVVAVVRRRAGMPRPIVAHTLAPIYVRGFRAPNPVVVSRLLKQVRPCIIESTRYDGTKQAVPNRGAPIIVPRPARGRRLKGIVTILPADMTEILPPLVARPLVVPSRLKGSKALRSPIIVASKSAVSYRKIPVFDPIVVPRLRGRKAAPWVFTSQFLQFTVPPPRHDPTPRTLFVRTPRRRVPLIWPQPQFTMSIRQPDDQRYDKPWDLIAACIAWLRTKPAIVAEFGDAKGTPEGEKFVSDVALPKTSPPYVVFSEPREVENYETTDQNNLRSSVVTGVFLIEVLATEKLDARQKADKVAASLQDAPLVFSDGVLMYLRRSERQFPSFKATGVGGDVTMYKRIVEFNYMIERFF